MFLIGCGRIFREFKETASNWRHRNASTIRNSDGRRLSFNLQYLTQLCQTAGRQRNILLAVIGISGILAACSWPGGQKITKYSPRLISQGKAIPKGGGSYKIGKPYKIKGKWYKPRVDKTYNRTGIASWYGDDFHGRQTANGEIYDMNALTAAHPLLPMPVYAHVTNLSNGRSIIVRINDRGPYARNREIDLSKKSAELLGFKKRGTTRVRVRYVGRAPINGNDTYERKYLGEQGWYRYLNGGSKRYAQIRTSSNKGDNKSNKVATHKIADRNIVIGHLPWSEVTSADIRADLPPIYQIEAGLFYSTKAAEQVSEKLVGIETLRTEIRERHGKTIFAVLLGPYVERTEAEKVLREAHASGAPDARIIALP